LDGSLKGEAMNQISRLFDELKTVLGVDPTSPRVETLASDIAAKMAHETHPLCVGIVNHGEPSNWVINQIYVLQPYGVLISASKLENYTNLYLMRHYSPSRHAIEFEGNVCMEHRLEVVAA
jgi:hypothetical protein